MPEYNHIETVNFEFLKATNTTYRYHEIGKDDHSIGTVYIKKHVLGENPPKEIAVLITTPDPDELEEPAQEVQEQPQIDPTDTALEALVRVLELADEYEKKARTARGPMKSSYYKMAQDIRTACEGV